MSTPVITTQFLKELAAKDDAALVANVGVLRTVLEEHRRLRDQVGVMNELALARSLLLAGAELAGRDMGQPSESAKVLLENLRTYNKDLKVWIAAVRHHLGDRERVTVATAIGIRRDGSRLRVLFHDGVTDRLALDLAVLEVDTLAEAGGPHRWLWQRGMAQAPLDPLRRSEGACPKDGPR